MLKFTFDVLIKNGRIIDGCGNPWYKADIGISNGKIVAIGYDLNSGKRTIDASNLIVCPGFIDTHSHTDYVLPFLHSLDSFIYQGITTCVTGRCGSSYAPIVSEQQDDIKKMLGNIFPLFSSFDFPWKTFKEYMDYLENQEYSLNIVNFVGYENIRVCAGAGFEDRVATNKELLAMKKLLREALEAGAYGLSTGLIYAPQVYVQTNELIDLLKAVSQYNVLYFTHIRGEGCMVIEAVKEAIKIVTESDCVGGQISHHKISGKAQWGLSETTLKLLEDANQNGISITCDSYPYIRGFSSLVTSLPPWTREGGPDETLKRLKNPTLRERIINDITEGLEGWDNWIKQNGFENLFISMAVTDKWKEFEGKNISEITKILNMNNDWETYFTILIEEEGASLITIQSMSEEDIRRIMKSRYHMFGTDGIAMSKDINLGKCHPRFFGTYPRILGKYVREENLFTLEEAIRKMTSFPAQRLGIRDRGMIKIGNWGDIVIFDPQTISDKASYLNPLQYPEGLLYVIVNGQITVDNSQLLDIRAGRILRRSI